MKVWNQEWLSCTCNVRPIAMTAKLNTITLFDVHVTVHHDTFLTIKPTRCTNFSNLFLEWNSTCFGQFLCPSSGVFHCTHSNGICHTGLLTACEQEHFLLLSRCQQTCMTYTGCPTRYQTRHFFNNSNTNEDIATKFEQEYVHGRQISYTMR
jgi:hypothetical protein